VDHHHRRCGLGQGNAGSRQTLALMGTGHGVA
jgi:hypothetical protein